MLGRGARFDMFKLALSVLLVAALQPAAVRSVPADSGPTLMERLQIIGHAAVEVFKSVGELGKNLTTIVEQGVQSEANKLAKLFMARITLMSFASGHDYYEDESADGQVFTAAKLRQFRVVTTSVEEAFGRLDTMEAANDLIVRTIRQTVNETYGPQLTKEELLLLLTALDRNFLASDGAVRKAYEKARQKYDAQVPFPSRKGSRKGVDEPVRKNKKFAKSLMNFVFLQYAYSRLTTPREPFLLARSVIELAKKPAKFERVQRIYDETLSTQSELMDLRADDFKANQFHDSWFAKLKENFEKERAVGEELKLVQKEVAERKDWDRSIFDLPV